MASTIGSEYLVFWSSGRETPEALCVEAAVSSNEADEAEDSSGDVEASAEPVGVFA